MAVPLLHANRALGEHISDVAPMHATPCPFTLHLCSRISLRQQSVILLSHFLNGATLSRRELQNDHFERPPGCLFYGQVMNWQWRVYTHILKIFAAPKVAWINAKSCESKIALWTKLRIRDWERTQIWPVVELMLLESKQQQGTM